MLFKQSVSSNLLVVLERLMKIDELIPYRLVGGTALALQLGHRNSVDIDLFSYKEFSKKKLEQIITKKIKATKGLQIGERHASFFIHSTKIDIFSMDVPFIRPAIIEENIRMASLEDIAAMKLEAVTDRATKKDYYDIAELLTKFSLKNLIGFYEEKYPHMSSRNVINILRDIPIRNFDLEGSIPPKIFTGATWKDIKSKIFSAFDDFRNEELNRKIEEMKKRKKDAGSR